jgi:alkaline phosphatase D
MKNFSSILFLVASTFLSSAILAQANKLISGPWAGNIELRTAMVWLEVSPEVKKAAIKYKDSSAASEKTVVYNGTLGKDFNPIKFELNGLNLNTTYWYEVYLDGKKISLDFPTSFKTKELWQWRKPAPDFSFIAGSCNYINEPQFDRPGKGYGADSSIFETMAKSNAQFNIWLGDNWYTREVDYSSAWGLNYRASHDRAVKSLQPFMASMPQYAIWDDHDFGPNDACKSYILKSQSRDVFNNYFLNPTSGEDNKGIYTQFSYSDADFFLMDDRFFRSNENLEDSVNGFPNKEKTFFGTQQLDWLKNALLTSKATFKFIVTGNQVLNAFNQFESMQHYSYEYHSLLDFLKNHEINGIVFLTGDRHHGEIMKLDRVGSYPLFDITLSPLTSGVAKPAKSETNNPQRVPNTLVEAQHFGKLSISGAKNERVLKLDFVGIKGDILATWSISQKEISNPK